MASDRSKVLQQAQLYASRGQYDAAIAEWKKLASDAPNDGSIHNSIGDLHLKRNAGTEATTSFLQAAAAFRTEGATLKAIAAFKKVLKIDPTRYEVYRHLGDLNAERGLLSSAVQDYLTLGKYYLKERKGKEALEIYKKIVNQDPSNLDAQQRVAELCVQENLQDEATKVYLQLGRERSAQGRYDEAKDAYLAVLRIDPKNSEAVQFVDSVDKHSTGSLNAGKPAPGSAPQKSSEPLDLLAEATRRIDEKQYAGAEAILNQLLTREPGNPQVCRLLARLHLQRGDVQVALGEYRFLAGAALRAQEYSLAESLIAEFLAAEPNSVPLIELYGELYEERGEGPAAAQQYAKAIELLLEQPEAGMESLHEELFEKVKALSNDSELINRLAMRITGEPPAPEPGITPPPGIAEPQADGAPPLINGHAFDRAEPHETPALHIPSAVAMPEGTAASEVAEAFALAASNGEHLTAPPDDMQNNVAEVTVPAPEEPVFAETCADPSGAVLPPGADRVEGEETAAVAVSTPIPAHPEPADCETHFTLGVAFKNMGLYQEAQEEFALSMHMESFFLDSCLMTSLCYKERGELAQAISGLESVLTDPRCQGAKGQAIRYELGLLYEAEAQWENAVKTFQSIPVFHDVPQRLASLKDRSGHASEFRLAS